MPFLADRVFDVVVVGGGILGLSVARDCAMRRLTVALFEKDDFGSGSTGKVPGILSGEPHWLEEDRDRTKAACDEIQVFNRIAPNLISRIPTLNPVLRSEPKSRLLHLEALGCAYNRFSAQKGGRASVRLTEDDVLGLEPGFTKDIQGAVSWDEWVVDLPRLAILTGKSAAAAGAQLYNRISVERVVLQDKKVVGVVVHPEGRETTLVRTRAVVNATGQDCGKLAEGTLLSLNLRYSKTVSLRFERRIADFAITCSREQLSQSPILFPQDRTSTLMSAEISLAGPPDETSATDEDLDALLREGKTYFPRLCDYRVMEAQVAIRPFPVLPLNPGKKPETGEDPRSHLLVDHAKQGAEGFYTLAGGNIGMSRRVAELATDRICRQFRRREPCRTQLESLPDCVTEMPWMEESQRTGLDPITVKRLMTRQGFKAHDILNAIGKDPKLARTLCECEQVTAAEVEYCVRKEWAKSVCDLGRRTRLGTGPCSACRCIDDTALFLGHLLGWTSERVELEMRTAARERSRFPLFGEQAKQEEYARWILGEG